MADHEELKAALQQKLQETIVTMQAHNLALHQISPDDENAQALIEITMGMIDNLSETATALQEKLDELRHGTDR